MLPVICFVGSSGVGKTTIIENVVRELKTRGFRLAVVKHAPHGFNIDREGKDSWRFSRAGADVIAITSHDKLCLIHQMSQEPALTQIIASLETQVDLVLVEGYKDSPWPKIEVVRSPVSSGPLHSPQEMLAIISDQSFPLDLPQFRFQDIKAIANFLIAQISMLQLTCESTVSPSEVTPISK